MNDITKPLILWRGSHEAGSGKGCAMNVISWENGDKTITDYPNCSDWMLARLVQAVNDDLAQDDGSLTPEDSMRVLDLGHATVGTAYHDLSDQDLQRVYVRLAVHAARKVVHLTTSPTAQKAIDAAEAWADDPSDENRSAAHAAAYAAYAASDAAAAAAAGDAADAAAAAAAAAYAASAYAADAYPADAYAAYAYAAAAADAAAAAAADPRFHADLTAELIDLFKQLTNTGEYTLPVPLGVAVERMQEVKV